MLGGRMICSACLLAWRVAAQLEASVSFKNDAAIDIDVWWRNEQQNIYSLLSSVKSGLSSAINTFKGHRFLVAETGRSVEYTERPNFVAVRAEHGLVVRGATGQLSVAESDATRVKAGLPPRQLNTNSSARSTTEKAELLIRNRASDRLDVLWQDAPRESYFSIVQLDEGSETIVSSFRGHSFYIARTNENVTYQTHPPNFRLQEPFEVMTIVDGEDAGLELIEGPPTGPAAGTVRPEDVRETVSRCRGSAACIANVLYRPRLSAIQKGTQDSSTVREELEEKYRDYACHTHEKLLPQAYATTTWTYDPDGEGSKAGSLVWRHSPSIKAKRRRLAKVDRLFESPRSDAQIYLVHNFISENECQMLTSNAEPRLADASVTGEAPGEKVVSKSRRAKAAMVGPETGSLIAGLQDRVFSFANHHIPYENFTTPGQEPFNVIMYNRTGDEYKIHCDGYCDSSFYVRAGRAATVVMYCEEAVRGGQTSFTNADLVLKGRAGQAVFFHYRDKDGYMDSGWTKHGGCPVLEGRKWIATQWIRDGVSAKDPWHYYTPTGDLDTEAFGRADLAL